MTEPLGNRPADACLVAKISFSKTEAARIESIKISGVGLDLDYPIILKFGEELVVKSDGLRSALIYHVYQAQEGMNDDQAD